jgi:hypothetical protein
MKFNHAALDFINPIKSLAFKIAKRHDFTPTLGSTALSGPASAGGFWFAA